MDLKNTETQLLISLGKVILSSTMVIFIGIFLFTGENLWEAVSPDTRLIFLGLIYIGFMK